MPESDPSHQPSSNPSLGRRTFLRHSAISIGATVHEFMKHRDAPSPKKREQPIPDKTGWLRPPGAAEEKLFLERCTGCADCMDACPYGAIQVLSSNDTPVIYPGESPCKLCDDLPCIEACETDALLPVGSRFQVKMGVATVWSKMCTAGTGCNSCVSTCPTEALSMDFSSYQIRVDDTLCVGCGMCQYTCGTVNDRTAIRIIPR